MFILVSAYNVLIWICIFKFQEIIKGTQSKIKFGIPHIDETPIIHDISHVVYDVFKDHLCQDLPGNKRKLFDSPVSIYIFKSLYVRQQWYFK